MWLSNVFLETLLFPYNGHLFWLTVSEFVFCELYQLGRGLGAAGAGEEAAAGWAGSGRQEGGLRVRLGGRTPLSLNPQLPFRAHTLLSRCKAWGPAGVTQGEGVLVASRSVSGYDVEDGSSFLLTASPDWWLGEWGVLGPGHLLP